MSEKTVILLQLRKVKMRELTLHILLTYGVVMGNVFIQIKHSEIFVLLFPIQLLFISGGGEEGSRVVTVMRWRFCKPGVLENKNYN